MQHAGSIFTDIELLLLAINRSTCEASDEEITGKCEAYAEALVQFDSLLALLRVPSGMATPADIAAARQHAKLAMA
jgi:hypothetical protein